MNSNSPRTIRVLDNLDEIKAMGTVHPPSMPELQNVTPDLSFLGESSELSSDDLEHLVNSVMEAYDLLDQKWREVGGLEEPNPLAQELHDLSPFLETALTEPESVTPQLFVKLIMNFISVCQEMLENLEEVENKSE